MLHYNKDIDCANMCSVKKQTLEANLKCLGLCFDFDNLFNFHSFLWQKHLKQNILLACTFEVLLKDLRHARTTAHFN